MWKLLLLLPLVALVACQWRPKGAAKLPASLRIGPQDRVSYDWNAHHRAVKAANARIHPEYVFIGASIVHYWGGVPQTPPVQGEEFDRAPEAWNSLFGKHSVVNMGFGFDYIDNAYYRIRKGELADARPRVILIQLGTNNIGHRQDSPEACAENMRAFLQLLRAEVPEAKILLIGLLPHGEASRSGTIAATNKLFSRLADGENVFYVDLCPVLAKSPATPTLADPRLFGDNVHPNKAGYEAMAPVLRRALRKMDPLY